MITSVDTNILLDILLPDPNFGIKSMNLFKKSLNEGSIIVCDIVLAEVSGFFSSIEVAKEILKKMEVKFTPVDHITALNAGFVWKEYRRKGGKKDRIVADFLIGSFAKFQSDRLLTRDRGFYRTYFSDITILEPL